MAINTDPVATAPGTDRAAQPLSRSLLICSDKKNAPSDMDRRAHGITEEALILLPVDKRSAVALITSRRHDNDDCPDYRASRDGGYRCGTETAAR